MKPRSSSPPSPTPKATSHPIRRRPSSKRLYHPPNPMWLKSNAITNIDHDLQSSDPQDRPRASLAFRPCPNALPRLTTLITHGLIGING